MAVTSGEERQEQRTAETKVAKSAASRQAERRAQRLAQSEARRDERREARREERREARREARLNAPPLTEEERKERREAAISERAAQRSKQPGAFIDLTSFCVFACNSRSGHSITGALLDAHPNAMLPHEEPIFARPNGVVTDTFRYPDRLSLLARLVAVSEIQGRRGRNSRRVTPDGNKYQVSYSIEGSHQGVSNQLLVLGTKRGDEMADLVGNYGEAPLHRLRELVDLPLKFVHSIRNPFDNIATLTGTHDTVAIDKYLFRERAVGEIKRSGWDMHDIYLEDLIADPKAELARLLEFLDLDAPADLVETCTEIVMSEPNETRHARTWSQQDIEAIRAGMEELPWLKRYIDTEVSVGGTSQLKS